MSSMNPLKFFGGLVLEVGAVIAALAILPGLGGLGGSNPALSNTAAESIIPNQVYFDANSSRVMDEPVPRTSPPAAWQNDYAPPPPVSQQRFVENTLDHNSQRALDAAARLWNQGDRLLPPDLRVRRDVVDDRGGEPLREYSPRDVMPRDTTPLQREPQQREVMPRELMTRTADYRTDNNYANNYVAPSQPTQPASPEYRRPSYYAPPTQRSEFTPRYSAQEQPRRLDERY
jgi:hypothetical protein